ncbi:hypothetical protein DFQ03_2729 [Maribacter caenipelagi]|uniref:Pectate lyase n=1 Tax=Maribacter caenipelagi TaxID=1447781 RepID=A0A4V6PZY7_9FLAO|nr:Ig-like domain-containing protein [Maribacter caenipelagi]TDS13438.1 hypothetical protein DFQ03_2729 [Maribacter caenipelagi]
MSKFIRFSTKLTLSIFATIFLFSCSKDADLLSEYVITTDDTRFENSLLINDSFYMAEGQTTILMDVLNNDNVSSNSNITIIETSSPINGIVTINDDNTLTYKIGTEEATPDETTPEEDSFTYTAEVVNEETGEQTEEQATVTISISDNGPVKAFPSAYGGGSNSTGGRGKVLAIINTLNVNQELTYYQKSDENDEYYVGGLYSALQNENVGYIIFNVSGNIELGQGGTENRFGSAGIPNVNQKTIFGQSAPLGGITLTGGAFRINGQNNSSNNLIIRYLRSRPIYNKTGQKSMEDDSYTWGFLFYGGYNVIIDHCSVSFAQDKAIGAYIHDNVDRIENFTFSHNFIQDSHTAAYIAINPGRPGNPEDKVNLISFNKNVIVGSNRTPNLSFNGLAEKVNNVIQSIPSKQSSIFMGLNLNEIGNYYSGDDSPNKILDYINVEYSYESPSVYTRENYFEKLLTGDLNEDNSVIWSLKDSHIPAPSNFFTNNPHIGFPNPIEPLTPQETYTELIQNGNVGAFKYLDNNGRINQFRDSFDTSQLEIVSKNLQYQTKSENNWTLPSIPSNMRPESYDTDMDGMSDSWELREFGSLNESYRGDYDGDGYENIEEYMNQVDN